MKIKTVKDKLLQINKEEKEPFLFPVLKQLFATKKYECVEITHGINEYGKDLVFKEYDTRLGTERWFAVVVKNKDASVKDFEDSGEIYRQIKLSFEHPYTDSKGNDQYINYVIVIVNGTISNQAKSILQKVLPPHFRSNVEIWNYQRLEDEINKEIKDLFLSENGMNKEDIIITKYKNEQIRILSDLENAKDIYTGLNIFEINDIFVNIRTSLNKYQDEKNRYQDEKQHLNEEIDDSISILTSNKNTLIRGIATSGKSLLLKRIGIKALQTHKEKSDAVFYFKFRKLAASNNINIDAIINEQFKNLTNGESFDREYFDKLILLFDGLDELREEKLELVKIINDYISAQNESKLPIKVIISSRNLDIFENELFENYEQITLLPFDVGQAFSLVKKIIPNDKGKANNFINAIKSNQLSNSLTRTPMALTLTAILYRDGEVDLSELPANITELYNKFSDYYLNRWDTSKGISLQYKYEETKHILAFIAEELHEKGIQEIASDDLKVFLINLKNKHSLSELEDIDRFINSLKDRVGLIRFNEREKNFGFYNLSFQEYFASIYFDDSNEDVLLNNLYREWWENTIIFYCGKQPKRDVFLHKAIKNIIPIDIQQHYQHISLLSKCLQASHLISNESQEAIIKNLIYNFDQLYKKVIDVDKNNIEEKGLTYKLTTLDVILQFRNIFERLFQTKHIHFNTFSDIALEILTNSYSGYSDVTLYSISYFLSHKLKDPVFLSEFIKTRGLNTRWTRIVFRDIEYLKLKQKVEPDVYNRIKRKQEHNRKYINQQFKEPAIRHLIDGYSLSIEDSDSSVIQSNC